MRNQRPNAENRVKESSRNKCDVESESERGERVCALGEWEWESAITHTAQERLEKDQTKLTSVDKLNKRNWIERRMQERTFKLIYI